MSRRWLIRSCLLLPVLFCALAWPLSAFYDLSLRFAHKHWSIGCATLGGLLLLDTTPPNAGPSYPDGWHVTARPLDHPSFWPSRTFGFQGLGLYVHGYYSVTLLPYWLLLPAASLTAFYGWRKTRRRSNPAAFPIAPHPNPPPPSAIMGHYFRLPIGNRTCRISAPIFLATQANRDIQTAARHDCIVGAPTRNIPRSTASAE